MSVLPEPVGARISVCSPAAMAGQPCSWASVGAGNEDGTRPGRARRTGRERRCRSLRRGCDSFRRRRPDLATPPRSRGPDPDLRRVVEPGSRQTGCSSSMNSPAPTATCGPSTGSDFTVQPGRLVGFLGPNGAGKTTAMRVVMGLERPDCRRGDVERLTDRRRRAPAHRLPPRGARPVPEDADRRPGGVLRAAARDGPEHRRRGRSPVARADGADRPVEQRHRERCRSGTSSGCSWRWPSCTSPTC